MTNNTNLKNSSPRGGREGASPFVGREGAFPRGGREGAISRYINSIIVHCSATPEGKNFTVEDIDRWHRQRGWRCIGYHYVVYLDGSVHKGRDESEVGAHCKGHNAHSIGVCYIGGTSPCPSKGGVMQYKPKDTRTQAQKAALVKLIRDLKHNYPNAVVFSHSDFANKACPCFDAHKEYATL